MEVRKLDGMHTLLMESSESSVQHFLQSDTNSIVNEKQLYLVLDDHFICILYHMKEKISLLKKSKMKHHQLPDLNINTISKTQTET